VASSIGARVAIDWVIGGGAGVVVAGWSIGGGGISVMAANVAGAANRQDAAMAALITLLLNMTVHSLSRQVMGETVQFALRFL